MISAGTLKVRRVFAPPLGLDLKEFQVQTSDIVQLKSYTKIPDPAPPLNFYGPSGFGIKTLKTTTLQNNHLFNQPAWFTATRKSTTPSSPLCREISGYKIGNCRTSCVS